MSFAINTNVVANKTYGALSQVQGNLNKSLERLSTGSRINTAADDAAGLSISEGLRSRISGFQVASRNAQDGISVIQTAEGALGEVGNILHRMRDLAVQAGNDSNSAESRAAIKAEADELANELYRIQQSTNFNGINLLDGSAGDAGVMSFQVGADAGDHSVITVSFSNVATVLGDAMSTDGTDGTALEFDTAENASTSLTAIDSAITALSTHRSGLGASQNRLESALATIQTATENLQAADSRIRDVDMAAEMVNYSKNQILAQAGLSMLSQANSAPQNVLALLR